jgi:hypothetical protein
VPAGTHASFVVFALGGHASRCECVQSSYVPFFTSQNRTGMDYTKSNEKDYRSIFSFLHTEEELLTNYLQV